VGCWRWLAVVTLSASACTSSVVSPPVEVVVTRVVDGDTVDVSVHRTTHERVRLIGIDTPENVRPGETPECFGPEASRRLNELVPPGSRVRLERDVVARDPFGRLLAYVYVGDDMINLTLAREGFAKALSIPPNTAYQREFTRAVAAARARGSGLWGACTR
jgi:micrococcal nuclease